MITVEVGILTGDQSPKNVVCLSLPKLKPNGSSLDGGGWSLANITLTGLCNAILAQNKAAMAGCKESYGEQGALLVDICKHASDGKPDKHGNHGFKYDKVEFVIVSLRRC
jgi:hypothetical protein